MMKKGAGDERLRLGEFKVLTFDCYGTLIDWETGILGVLRLWAVRHGVAASDEELLAAFAEAESACERATPGALYRQILRAAHARIAARWGITGSTKEAAALAESVGDWPAFADTVAALERLKARHKLVIVSNVDRVLFARTNETLKVALDAVITAEEVGAYKPDVRMFRRALGVLAQWGIEPGEVLHVAQSLYHDHVPAKALGLKTVWVNRRQGRPGWGATPPPPEDVQPDIVVATLAALVELEEHERQASAT